MKKIFKTSILILSIVLCMGVCIKNIGLHNEEAGYQKSIADKILRFHVIANSDSEDDQNVKLKVRDALLEYMAPYFEECSNKEQCKTEVLERLDEIKMKAEEILRTEGFEQTVDVRLQERYFPIKTYADYTFPAGEYEALCVEIGEAKGKNWWCVLYPRLCFMDTMYAVVPVDSENVLKEVLTPDEYDSVFTDGSKKIVIKSKAYEWLKNII